MGGGSKNGGGQKVPNYYMSMHFGACHGPIDSINQVWVKEMIIFCGKMTQNGTVYVNMPDLFGGQTSEGGVVGAVDCYLGAQDQLLTNLTACRYGYTATTMPAYRGIASLMFRRIDGTETGRMPQNGYSTDGSSGWFSVTDDGTLFDAAGGGYSPSGGFLWATNNPYLPTVWASITCIDKPIAPDLAEVYAPPDGIATLAGTDFNVGYPNWPPYSVIDLTDYADNIDLGGATFNMGLTSHMVGTGILAGIPMSGTTQVEATALSASGVDLGYVTGETPWLEDYGVPGGGSVNLTRTIPVGTRSIKLRGLVDPALLISQVTTWGNTHWSIGYTTFGQPICVHNGVTGLPPDMNPAHIIAACLTNPIWGMGYPVETLDDAVFTAAATTFKNENFGLSMMWSDQSKIEDFVQEVLDHVQALVFIDPTTGLWNLKPIRADYDPAACLVLDPSNCVANNRQRKLLGETINEIVVQWTNPSNEVQESVVFQDIANIAQQGGVVSDTRNYYGIRNATLANAVGARDLRSSAYPLFTVDIIADRIAAQLRPGDVVKFNWPEDGISGMLLRVFKVDYGKPGSASISLSCTEDIFALSLASYSTITKTIWADDSPTPVALAHEGVYTPPLPLLLRSGFSLSNLSDSDYPAVYEAAMGYDAGVQAIDIYGDVTRPTGTVETDLLGTVALTPGAAIASTLYIETTTKMSAAQIRSILRSRTLTLGDFLMAGSDNDPTEIMMVSSILPDNSVMLARGMFDTTPKAWPVGTFIWYLGDSSSTLVPTTEAAGSPSYFTFLPKTASGTLALADGTPHYFTPQARPYLPHRPANFAVAYSGGTMVTTHPYQIVNGGSEAGMAGWTLSSSPLQPVSVASAATLTGTILPFTGAAFFMGATVWPNSSMWQTLSIPYARWISVDAGLETLYVRRMQASYNGDDLCRLEVDFLGASAAIISTYVGADSTGGAGFWDLLIELIPIPALARDYVVRLVFTRVNGTVLNAYVDDISISYTMDLSTTPQFVASEVPTTATITWANRNRQSEDVVAPRWTDGNVTPETGQTVTLRLRDTLGGTLIDEVTGLTGTSYTYSTALLTSFRFMTVELWAERDGYESFEAAKSDVEFILLGYGNNYGYDYGENDGS